jgi:DNA topoisomerase-3
MARMLVICEERSVAEEVSRALGGSFAGEDGYLEGTQAVITWTGGPIGGLADAEAYDPKLASWQIEDLPIVPERFEVVVQAGDDAAKAQLKTIRSLVARRDIELLVNACDPGGEGELIFAYVRELAKGAGLPVERAWFRSLTRPAIRRAFGQLRPGAELRSLEDAARSRAEADWLVGVNATRAATVRGRALGGRITLGRVLTPALAMLVQHEREIEEFEPHAYRVLDAAFEPPSGTTRYRGRWFRGDCSRLPDAAVADQIAERVRGGIGIVRELITCEQHRPVPRLYDLAALQDEAARWHGLTAQRTLSAAQECYEKGLLSYPRTTSRHLSSDRADELRTIAAHVGRASIAYAEAAAYVERLEALPLEQLIDDGRVGDHHAMVPTDATHDLARLGEDARRIYDMVARRFLAAFFSSAVLARTTVITEIEGETFRSRGQVVVDAGWRAAYLEPPHEPPDGDDEEVSELPELREGLQVRCARVESSGHETTPRPQPGDASLGAAGLGTPGTRGATIERLIELGYVLRDGRSLRPTPKGMQVIDLVGEHPITSPELMGAWEARLVGLERGEQDRDELMREIVQFTTELVSYLRDLPDERTRFPRRDLGIVCPRCGEGTLIENRKGFGCSTWSSREQPGCGFVIWKTIAGRPIGEEVVRELVERGRTRELQGFRSRAGAAFRASLVLDARAEQPVTFGFGEAAPRRRRGA